MKSSVARTALLIDVGGVIYWQTSTTTLSEAGDQGDAVMLHTQLIVRDDQLALYGFMTEEEMTLFELVTGVTRHRAADRMRDSVDLFG
ncbi:MAG: OB-fold domain-containing protein [Thermomicrobiales bacterium]